MILLKQKFIKPFIGFTFSRYRTRFYNRQKAQVELRLTHRPVPRLYASRLTFYVYIQNFFPLLKMPFLFVGNHPMGQEQERKKRCARNRNRNGVFDRNAKTFLHDLR